jgi:polysaccharide biosynthesis protein VpsQ
VGLLDFNSSVGLSTVLVGFDSHSLPPTCPCGAVAGRLSPHAKTRDYEDAGGGIVIKINRHYALGVAAYILFLIGIVVLANLGIARWVFTASTLVPFGDKFCHMILMGLFSFLLNSALCCRMSRLFRIRVLTGSLVACLLVLGEEVSQFWVASRNVEVLDALFDLVGIYLFGLLASLNLRMKAKALVPIVTS